MNQATPAPHGQGGLNLTPSDIFFILFRHKTKIVLFALLGIVAGATVYKLWPEEYQSNAQLLVRYVTEKRDVIDSDENTRVTSAAGRGSEYILQTEIAILTSLDLAQMVAEKIGPEVIVPEYSDDMEIPIENLATSTIAEGINAEAKGNVISVQFINEHPNLPRSILQTLIDTYVERHVQVHRGTGGAFEDLLTQQTDQLKAKLAQTENELLKALNKAGVNDIREAKVTLANEMARIQQAILETQVELAESESTLGDLQEPSAIDSSSTEEEVISDGSLANAVDQYEATRTALEIQKSRERELLMSYTEANSLVKGVREQIQASEAKLEEIESQFPAVNQTSVIVSATGQTMGASRSELFQAQRIRAKALHAKLDILGSQFQQLEERSNRIKAVEININELERRKTLEETNYHNFLSSLERSRLEEALSSGKISNISVIQSPSNVTLALSEKVMFAGVAAAGFAALGLVWAFLVELFLDRTVKRPIEIQRDIGLPLFMTIPDTKGKAFKRLTKNSSARNKQIFGKSKAAQAKNKKSYTPKSSTLQAAAKSNPEYYGAGDQTDNGGGEITPWDVNHPLHNYFEALRDKVIGYFESKNLQHKPKLIGLTGLGENPGVTTVASGIASSLSKTEGGNVLLVDMTLGKESAHQFYKGEEVSNLEEALLEPQKAKLQDNLYVVAEGSNGYKLPSLLPSRFNSIIPKLKASDFDYIVFDMPAVSPISSTPRLASFMDVMLMVIESENTNKEVVKQAAELLSDSKAHLGAVLNKTKSYVPKQLEQDFIGLS
jgi:uncharacterized protein involved in exopolysaccharide biosynthesis/Mrp family chromosome partitioning ATPase